jgi:predicted enzyme related to lactoylglutathione lyase
MSILAPGWLVLAPGWLILALGWLVLALGWLAPAPLPTPLMSQAMLRPLLSAELPTWRSGSRTGRRTQVPQIDVLFAGIPVADLDAAVAWYARLFGRPADIVVNADEVMWRLADAAWLYVISDKKKAGHSLVTLAVSDLDKTVAEIGGRGIVGGPVEIIGSAGRKASFADADGNTISLIEVTAAAG